jgi:hypothetical protein
MSFKHSLLAAAAALAAASSVSAAPVLWFSDVSNRLGTVDMATGSTSLIGVMNRQMTDLAFSPTGVLYGTTFSQLYTIDTSTGATTLVGTHNTNINSLVFGSDGTLYGGSNVLYTLNTATGAASAIGNMGASSSGDLAFVGGKLYLSATAGNDSLRLIDPATGAGSFVGNIGRSSVFGLASPDGSDLYGMSGNSVFEIDPATGAAGPTIYSLAGFSSVYGTTFYGEATPPIPEPSTYALMALGLAVVGLVARRRRVV